MEEKKLVPKRRFRGFELGWEEKSFELLAEIVRGASPRPIEDPKWFDNNSNIGWLRISDVTSQNGRITNLEQKISVLGQQKTRVIRNSHLLLSIAATVGKPVINYVETGVHDGFLIFLKPKFDIEYMYQWLEMFRSKWQQYGQPGSQVNLNSDIVKKHIFLIPNIKEQEKIGAFFKVLDERIANQERKIAKVKDLKLAYLTEMFPQEGETVPKRRFKGFEGEWKKCKLKDYTSIITKGTTPKNPIKNGKVNFVKVENIKNDMIYPDSKITEEEHENYLKRSKLETNDILFSIAGTLGRVSIVEESILPANTNQALAIIRGHKFDSEFLLTSLSGKVVSDFIKRNPTIGAQPNLSLEQVGSFIIYTPTFKEQQKIGQFFKNLDNQIEMEEAKLDKLKKMKEAYLEEMFV